jgi:hypothetical protein
VTRYSTGGFESGQLSGSTVFATSCRLDGGWSGHKGTFNAGARTVAAARPPDLYVKSLLDYRKTTFEGFVSNVDVALDIVGRDAQVIENVGLTAGYFKLT